MGSADAFHRLQAWAAGKPLPAYSTIHFPIVPRNDLLIISFLRMGGESAPWAIGYGHPGKTPTVLTVPEARNRDLVAEMAAEFATVLLEHFGHPTFSEQRRTGPADQADLRQIWLPNGTHIDMLQFLSYAYTFTKWGREGRASLLNALGRLTGWLFREARRPGQVTVLDAAEVLRRSYIFPAESVRQAHLGFLLAWLETAGDRAARVTAAQLVEQESISTSLDPRIERDELEPHVTRWNELGARENRRLGLAEARRIESILTREIKRRHQLVESTLKVLQSDGRPMNPGCSILAEAGLAEHWFQYLRLERQEDDPEDGIAFTPSPETDLNPRAAASRYFVQEASEALRIGALVHHDSALQKEAVAGGEGIRGEVLQVRNDSTTRATKPVWVVAIPDTGVLKVREGTRLCPVGVPKRTVIVRDVVRRGAMIHVAVEVVGLKTAQPGGIPAATDQKLEGQQLTLVPTSMEGLSRRKSKLVWDPNIPGGWLTHARPAGRAAALGTDLEDGASENLYERLRRG